MNEKNKESKRDRGGGRAAPSFVLSDAQVEAIIKRDLATVVDSADKLAQAVAQLSKARVRGIYATVLQLRARWEGNPSDEVARDIANRLYMLRPRVAYLQARERMARKREREEAAVALVAAIDKIIPKVGAAASKESIDGFFDFFEALVAYHHGYAKN